MNTDEIRADRQLDELAAYEKQVTELEAELVSAMELARDVAAAAPCNCDAKWGHICSFHRRFGSDPLKHIKPMAAKMIKEGTRRETRIVELEAENKQLKAQLANHPDTEALDKLERLMHSEAVDNPMPTENQLTTKALETAKRDLIDVVQGDVFVADQLLWWEEDEGDKEILIDAVTSKLAVALLQAQAEAIIEFSDSFVNDVETVAAYRAAAKELETQS